MQFKLQSNGIATQRRNHAESVPMPSDRRRNESVIGFSAVAPLVLPTRGSKGSRLTAYSHFFKDMKVQLSQGVWQLKVLQWYAPSEVNHIGATMIDGFSVGLVRQRPLDSHRPST